ncbi:hypothetical protein RAH32_12205 [Paracoccus sp. WLY502]|uniref:hypothetical protein n=1 Tax=Paracoccus yibinensis TaxID=3068891 RepID=UPI002796B11E|nr:hypothetical protein [Paracoccus sp. WLY502]MDQ1901204.1 hypothetical protein [Paracoccus sp. WLY502]
MAPRRMAASIRWRPSRWGSRRPAAAGTVVAVAALEPRIAGQRDSLRRGSLQAPLSRNGLTIRKRSSTSRLWCRSLEYSRSQPLTRAAATISAS